MKSYFITGTGTGIGKTLLTCALVHQLHASGKRACAIKPVISGFKAELLAESDTGLLLAAQGMALSPENMEAISPWRFAAPISPNMAAKKEGRTIDHKQLITFCEDQRDTDVLFVEGAGGVMSPLGDTYTVLDWAMALDYPILLATGSYLGSLSHTLTAARVIAQARLRLHAVVVSESETSPVALQETLVALRRLLPQEVRLAAISRLDSSSDLWKDVPDLIASLAL